MTSEYWHKIEALMQQREQEGRQIVDEAQKFLEEEASERLKMGKAAVQKLGVIFEAIRINVPHIKQAPLNEVREDLGMVSLRWGNKFDLTGEEKALVALYRRQQSIIAPGDVPRTIEQSDYFEIRTEVLPAFVRVLQDATQDWQTGKYFPRYKHFAITEFINEPDIALPAIVDALRTPLHVYRVLHKGRDYWLPPGRDAGRKI